MKAADVQYAVDWSGIPPSTVRAAIRHLLPILRTLREGRPWWLRMGMTALINALVEYSGETP